MCCRSCTAGTRRTELFGPVVAAAGHRLSDWSFASDGAPPAADAVLVFGGAIHPDQDDRHRWLKDELAWLERLIDDGVPTLGICLGSQLLARAAGAWVGPLAEPEIGWYEVELTDEGVADPVLSALPARFDALEWHHYAHGLPDGAVELARTTACSRDFVSAMRAGESSSIRRSPSRSSTAGSTDKTDLPRPGRLERETREQIGTWNQLAGGSVARSSSPQARDRANRQAGAC